ncbi:PA14 domain-containing protein [Neobacillus niacini]|uniref:PA14 domain-containing protein n=1 Tax=Neobacillus niacini TaxID=86668 RepID=UPI001C8E436F|nr:PA14 domain-containing protein [Neobacillus niacini]MBY0146315.1 glucosaminidase domain-containing protein [Neobacillus niacini]
MSRKKLIGTIGVGFMAVMLPLSLKVYAEEKNTSPNSAQLVQYKIESGNSAFSEVVPLDHWLAYYYPNKTLSGAPAAAKIIKPIGELKKLSENHGKGSPIAGIKNDQFSARYTSAKVLPAGEYILRATADDGVRVYVDGKLVLDRWSSAPKLRENAVKIQIADVANAKAGEKDVHWVVVEYYEGAVNSQVDVSLEPFQKSIEDTWVAEYYPNKALKGIPYVDGGKHSAEKVSNINFNWKAGSPHTSIPADGYSARFTKNMEFEEGTYEFHIRADDGSRLWVDDKLVIDSWVSTSGHLKTGRIDLSKGRHTVKVEYFEGTGLANLFVDVKHFTQIPTQLGKEVHYNWGSGSAGKGKPADKFTAVFDQTQVLAGGDYFIQAQADDGVKVEVDGQLPINRWSNSPVLVTNRALWTSVTPGQHVIKTHYYEDGGNASVFSDVVPFDSWLAYYYPNKTLSGAPTAAKVIAPVGELKKLSEKYGTGSPIAGIKNDQFSARYTTAKRIPAGDYILRATADDGVRVYVDGKLVLDRWSSAPVIKENAVKLTIADVLGAKAGEKDVHWVEVEYYEGAVNSQVEVFLEPFQASIENEWVAEFYPNKTLKGTPIVEGGKESASKLANLNFNWKAGSPHSTIPANGFSARFTKIMELEEGTYEFQIRADDGSRLWVDNKLVINAWESTSGHLKTGRIALGQGKHTVKVEYFEGAGLANFFLDYKKVSQTEAPGEEVKQPEQLPQQPEVEQQPAIDPSKNVKYVSSIKLPVYRSFEELIDYGKHLVFYNPSYTRFLELGYGDSVYVVEEKLYAARIQTVDGQSGWVHKDYLENNLSEDTWMVKDARIIRSSPSQTGTSIGTIPGGSSVILLEHITVPGSAYTEWYYIQTQSGQKGWIWGANNAGGNEGYNVIKYEFNKSVSTNQVTVFTPLISKANVTVDQINRFIDFKTGGKTTVMTNMGYAYLKAQEETGLNAIYLLAHSGLETGWGTSPIVKAKYNFYGIGAIDSRPDEGAYNYDTPEGGIIAGAFFIKKNYVDRSWDTDKSFPYTSKPTIDNMRFDNSWHQYATDEAWGAKIGKNASDFYNFITTK